MTARLAPDAELCRLLLLLPPLERDTELILLPNDRGHMAVLRPEGRPPMVFRRVGDGLEEVDPADDPALPGAGLLRQPHLLATVLEPLLGTLRSHELVAYRPGRRAVVRLYRADGGVSYLKLLDRRSFAIAAATFLLVQRVPAPMHLQLPAAELPAICAHVTRSAPGCSLRTLLAEGLTPPLPIVADAIAAAAAIDCSTSMPILDFTAAARAAMTMLRRGALLLPQILPLAERIAALRPPATAGNDWVHGDLHDKQLFLAGNAAHLIDLEGMAVGDRRFDAVNLAEHLRLRSLQQQQADAGHAERLLELCGYRADDDGIARFRAVVRARLAGVYALRPRWHDLAIHLQLEANHLLDQLS